MTEEHDRDRSGRFNQKHTDEDYLDAVALHAPAGTRDVADELGVNVETARLRLRDLADQDELDAKKIGNRLVFTVRQ